MLEPDAITQGPPTTARSSPEPTQTTPAEPIQGDIVVTAKSRHQSADPLAAVNAKSFAAAQAIDGALVGPLARGYERALPMPVRSGVRNFLENLHEPDVFVNYMLQLKPGKAAETLGRFVLNTTIGVAGLVDMAKRRPFHLPRRANGFADTFGYYGVKPGPFLFLPVIGATTPRDFIGLVMDRLLLPVAVGRPFNRPAYSIPTGVLHTLDRRSEFENELQDVRSTGDPYVARRDLYLQTRQAKIDRLHGHATVR